MTRQAPSVHTFPPHLLGLLIGLTLGWGFNWPAMKLAVREMAPMHFRTICLLAGAGGLFGFALTGRLPMRVPAGQWGRLIAIAFVNMAGWNIFAIYGVSLIASGRAAILGYTMPALAVLISAIVLHEPFTARRAAGVLLGLAGMALLLSRELHAVGRSPIGALSMVCAAFLWALGTVLMKRWPVSLPTTSFTAWQMLIASVPVLALALLFEHGSFDPFALSTWPMLGALDTIVVAFTFCYWAWTKIATEAPVGVSSLATMMIPVVGVFSSALVLGEMPHWQDYTALALVVASLGTVLIPAGMMRMLRGRDISA
jgi:drug/metabolite transporter (DMT)-like permease